MPDCPSWEWSGRTRKKMRFSRATGGNPSRKGLSGCSRFFSAVTSTFAFPTTVGLPKRRWFTSIDYRWLVLVSGNLPSDGSPAPSAQQVDPAGGADIRLGEAISEVSPPGGPAGPAPVSLGGAESRLRGHATRGRVKITDDHFPPALA